MHRLIHISFVCLFTFSMDGQADVTEGEDSKVERADDHETFQLLETKNDDANANFVTRRENFSVPITGGSISFSLSLCLSLCLCLCLSVCLSLRVCVIKLTLDHISVPKSRQYTCEVHIGQTGTICTVAEKCILAVFENVLLFDPRGLRIVFQTSMKSCKNMGELTKMPDLAGALGRIIVVN